ncbi:MAG: GNAT family N-acetyltransferase [Sphaerochaetaceae bacterium]
MKHYETKRLSLRTVTSSDLYLLKDYLLRNRRFLSQWEPLRPDSYYEDTAILQRIENEIIANSKQSQLSLYVSIKGDKQIIGNVTLSNIVRGPFQSCFIGYKLDEAMINNGYITEAIGAVIEIAFHDLELHRIEANIMPKNRRSIRVVEKLGFTCEGLSKDYLKINGIWEDHAHYVLLNSEMR